MELAAAQAGEEKKRRARLKSVPVVGTTCCSAMLPALDGMVSHHCLICECGSLRGIGEGFEASHLCFRGLQFCSHSGLPRASRIPHSCCHGWAAPSLSQHIRSGWSLYLQYLQPSDSVPLCASECWLRLQRWDIVVLDEASQVRSFPVRFTRPEVLSYLALSEPNLMDHSSPWMHCKILAAPLLGACILWCEERGGEGWRGSAPVGSFIELRPIFHITCVS